MREVILLLSKQFSLEIIELLSRKSFLQYSAQARRKTCGNFPCFNFDFCANENVELAI